MNIGRIKNIIIMLLVILATYQTSSLWFEESSGQSIISAVINNKSGDENGLKRYFTYPYRIIAGDGSDNFLVESGSMHESNTRTLCDDIIISALKNGGTHHQQELNWPAILTGNIVIYEYAFEMPVSVYAVSMGVRNTPLSQAIEEFTSIAIQPDSEMGVIVFFCNSVTGMQVAVSVKDSGLYSSFISHLQDEKEPVQVYYKSSVLSPMESNNNFFIPAWGSEGYQYSTGQASAVYYDSSVGVEKSTIRANLASFFDNPSAVYDATTDTIAFSDENAIVKYHNNDILEYVSYKRLGRKTDLLDDFAIAMDFITKRDLLMKNDFYLSGYEEKEGERRFYFDYTLDGMPVILSNALKEYIKEYTTNGISITVKDGNLINYTRLAYSFSAVGLGETTASDISPLTYMTASGMDADEFSKVSFGYMADTLDPISGTCSMALFMEFVTEDGISFIVE